MTEFNFDFKLHEALTGAPSDPESAAEVLRIAARYLREKKVLPWDLARHLAEAFETAMAKRTSKERNSRLLIELELAAENRRPAKAGWYDIGWAFDAEMRDNGNRPHKAKRRIADEFKVSLSTVERKLIEYRKAIAVSDAIDRENRDE